MFVGSIPTRGNEIFNIMCEYGRNWETENRASYQVPFAYSALCWMQCEIKKKYKKKDKK